jgi:hypothetical protein
MAKKNPSPNGENNLFTAIVGLVVISAITATACALICGGILTAFSDSHTMALFITDTGIKSDDKNLEHQLSSATLALKAVRDIGWALGIGSAGVAVAVFIRSRRSIK